MKQRRPAGTPTATPETGMLPGTVAPREKESVAKQRRPMDPRRRALSAADAAAGTAPLAERFQVEQAIELLWVHGTATTKE